MALQFWYERNLNWVILFIYNHSKEKYANKNETSAQEEKKQWSYQNKNEVK